MAELTQAQSVRLERMKTGIDNIFPRTYGERKRWDDFTKGMKPGGNASESDPATEERLQVAESLFLMIQAREHGRKHYI